MKNENLRKLVWAGLFTAFATVATMIIQVPSPTGGYVNAGDAIVLVSAFILGPWWGAAAAGLGSALADLIAGYVVYAPATLIIKGLMALTAGFILQQSRDNPSIGKTILAGVAAEIIMILGYYIFTATILGLGWAGSLAEIPGNSIQAIFGIACGTVLYLALIRIPYIKKLCNQEAK